MTGGQDLVSCRQFDCRPILSFAIDFRCRIYTFCATAPPATSVTSAARNAARKLIIVSELQSVRNVP